MSRLALTPTNVPALASAPTTPTLNSGDLYYNTSDSKLYIYTGSTWSAITGGGGGAAGDSDQTIIPVQVFS